MSKTTRLNLSYMKYLLLLFLPVFSKSQTCIILKQAKEAIYVGADSRGAAFVSVPGHKAVNMCKINNCGKFNFAISGVGFPIALEECKRACIGKQTFSEVINSFAPAFITKLKDSLEIIRQILPSLFIELTNKKEMLSSVIFFGVEADSFYIAQVKFTLITDKDTPVQINGVGGPYRTKSNIEPVIIASGMTDEIQDSIFKKNTWKAGTVETIRKLIKVEMKFHPKEVGGDIDVFKLSRKGPEWIKKKKICN